MLLVLCAKKGHFEDIMNQIIFSIFQFVLAAVLAVAAAAPSRSYEAPTYAPKVYQILKQEAELRDDQSYDSQ